MRELVVSLQPRYDPQRHLVAGARLHSYISSLLTPSCTVARATERSLGGHRCLPPPTRAHRQSHPQPRRQERSARTKHRIDVRLHVHRQVVARADVRAVVVRPEVDVRARDALEALDVRVDDRAAEEVEVEVVLCARSRSAIGRRQRGRKGVLRRSLGWHAGRISGVRDAKCRGKVKDTPKGCSISSPAAMRPRYMNAAMPTPGIAYHPNRSTSWKGRQKRYIHTVLGTISDEAASRQSRR